MLQTKSNVKKQNKAVVLSVPFNIIRALDFSTDTVHGRCRSFISRLQCALPPTPSVEGRADLTLNPNYQFIFILASISVWKSGTWRSSLPTINISTYTSRSTYQSRHVGNSIWFSSLASSLSPPTSFPWQDKHSPVKTSSQSISQSLPSKTSLCTPLAPPKTIGLHSPAPVIFRSICRFTGSAMPKLRRSISILRLSCVVRH